MHKKRLMSYVLRKWIREFLTTIASSNSFLTSLWAVLPKLPLILDHGGNEKIDPPLKHGPYCYILCLRCHCATPFTFDAFIAWTLTKNVFDCVIVKIIFNWYYLVFTIDQLQRPLARLQFAWWMLDRWRIHLSPRQFSSRPQLRTN